MMIWRIFGDWGFKMVCFDQEEKAKYLIVYDYGKPQEEFIYSDEELKQALKTLKEISEYGEYSYFDVFVYDENNKDISESQFIKEIVEGL
jgi:uncharacterized protein with von Willebrand factor type A (vWA) domain